MRPGGHGAGVGLVFACAAVGLLGFAAGRAVPPPVAPRVVARESASSREDTTNETSAPPVASTETPSRATLPVSSASTDEDALLARLKTLELDPARKRSIDETVELALGHQKLGEREVAALEGDLDAKATFDVKRLERLRDLARDDALAPRVLAAVARHPRREHADLLRDVSTDAQSSETIRYLASDLLDLPAVRHAASKELTLVLDLEAARACEAVAAVLTRAKSIADDRALPALRALDVEKGCGKDRKADCYECIRKTTALYEAREAASGRPFVPPWKLPSR